MLCGRHGIDPRLEGKEVARVRWLVGRIRGFDASRWGGVNATTVHQTDQRSREWLLYSVAPSVQSRRARYESFSRGCGQFLGWPLQDMRSLQSFLAPGNHPGIAPSTCIAHTIAILLHGWCPINAPHPGVNRSCSHLNQRCSHLSFTDGPPPDHMFWGCLSHCSQPNQRCSHLPFTGGPPPGRAPGCAAAARLQGRRPAARCAQRAGLYMCLYLSISIYLSIYFFYLYTCIRISTHTHTYIYIDRWIHTHTHTYIYIYIYIYI